MPKQFLLTQLSSISQVKIGSNFINTETGIITDSMNIDPSPIEIIDTVEEVVGIDRQVVDLSLIDNGKNIVVTNGFLVEVYLSGSDGNLTKLFKDDDLRPDGSIEREGFSKFIKLEVDVEE